MTFLRTSCNFGLNFLHASASRCTMQWFQISPGTRFLRRACRPIFFPFIAPAPSVQSATQFESWILFSAKYWVNTSQMSSPIIELKLNYKRILRILLPFLACISLRQNKSSSCKYSCILMGSQSQYRQYASNCIWLIASLESSIWTANLRLLNLCASCSLISLPS